MDTTSKIVISGANGAVGELLFNKFKQDNYSVEKLDLEKLDTNYDFFIHLAANTKNENIVESNIIYLQKCIEYCKKTNIKKFIFFSSVSVYGNINMMNVSEKSNYGHENTTYGLSKLFGESLLKEEDFDVLVLRLPAVLTRNTKNTFLYKLYERLMNNEDIVITNGNKLFNNFIDIDSLYSFLISYKFEIKYDLFILAVEQNNTLLEIVELLKMMLNSQSNIISSDKENNFFNLDNKKGISYSPYIQTSTENILRKWINLLQNKD